MPSGNDPVLTHQLGDPGEICGQHICLDQVASCCGLYEIDLRLSTDVLAIK